MALTDAQQDQVDKLKRLVGDTDLDDNDLWGYLQANSLNGAAAAVWAYKAASGADLVDVREGASSRSLSQLRANALAMRDHYSALVTAETPSASSRPRTRAIQRP